MPCSALVVGEQSLTPDAFQIVLGENTIEGYDQTLSITTNDGATLLFRAVLNQQGDIATAHAKPFTVVDADGQPQDFRLQLELVDNDGDITQADFVINTAYTHVPGIVPSSGGAAVRPGVGGGDVTVSLNIHDNGTMVAGTGDDALQVGASGAWLFGGDGNDTLTGGTGNDYLHGGSGVDEISGGAGNDAIVYDIKDSKLDGGEGIDFVLASDTDLTMDKLLNGWQDGPLDGPHAENVEVLIKGADALNLTSIEQMASQYGITVDGDKLKLDTSMWTEQADGSFTFKSGADLTLEVNGNSMATDPSSDMSHVVFALATGHGG